MGEQMTRLVAGTQDWRYPRKRQVIDPQKRYRERREIEQKLKAQSLVERSAK
jgi:hypothetical protein